MDRTLLEAVRAHGGDVDVWDDSINYGRAWVLDDEGEDVIQRVLRRIASETAAVYEDEHSVSADIWGWCEAHLGVMERFGREWNHDRAQIDGTDDGLCHAVTTVQQLATGDYCEEAYWWLAGALGAERMDPYVMESILRASDVLDELAGILRAEGREALADRLDDAWCAVRDVRCALRDLGPVTVTEAWRCSWCSRRRSGWASARRRRPGGWRARRWPRAPAGRSCGSAWRTGPSWR